VVETNLVTNVVQMFDRTFANVVTNIFRSWQEVTIQETNVVVPPRAPIGSTNSIPCDMKN
jgi:hypothetical protein